MECDSLYSFASSKKEGPAPAAEAAPAAPAEAPAPAAETAAPEPAPEAADTPSDNASESE